MATLPIIGQQEIRAMRREEFLRVIEIRGQRLASARKTLREWQQALTAAGHLWAEHPGWSLAQCLDAILAAHSQDTSEKKGIN
jgi:hypothetical protein